MGHFTFSSFLLLVGILWSILLPAQETKKTKKPELKPDSNYIVSYPDVFTVGVFHSSPVMQLTIKPVDKDLEKYKSEYRGNFADLLGFSLSYKKLSISYGFRTPFFPNDEKKGRTTSTGLTLKFRKPKYNLTAEYRQYTGYYDNNSPNYVPIHDSVSVRPDIRYKNIGLNIVYNFSWKKYSINAPLTFNDRQLKSRIGFLAKGGLNYTTISSSDSTLLSSVQTNHFTSFDDIRAINAILLKVGPGVGANIVIFKRFYLSLNYFVMGNFITYTYKVQNKGTSDWSTNLNIYTESAFGFGYNSKRLFAGFSLTGDINVMKVREASIRTNFGTVLVTVGYRFEAPRFLKKEYKKIPLLKG